MPTFGFPRSSLARGMSFLASAALLSACNGGDSTTATPVTGTVVGSYFQGAKVCLDANGNGVCDAGEVSTTSGSQGQFTLVGAAAPIVAEIDPTAGAKRLTSSGADITSTIASKIVLRAPMEAPGIVSVQSTSVVSEMETNSLSFAAARTKVAAALGVTEANLLTDYNTLTGTSAVAGGDKDKLQAATDSGLLAIQTAIAAGPATAVKTVLAKSTVALDKNKIKNVVVIYAENRSFDNLYGLFPNANGISRASAESKTQLDRDGVTPLSTLPAVWTASTAQAPTWSFVAGLPNGPFRIDAPQPGGAPGGVAASVTTPDLVHRFYNNQMQINGGKNNQFAAFSDAGGLSMGYYDGSSMAMWAKAQQFVLADNFFQGAFGGSFLNHQWLVCACAPSMATPPAGRVSVLDSILDSITRLAYRLTLAATSPASAASGKPVFSGDFNFTPIDATTNVSYAVNTTQPPYQPSGTAPAANASGNALLLADPAATGGAAVLAAQTVKTIGDTLTAKNVNWAWYSGAWNTATADGTQASTAPRSVIYNSAAGAANFQPHHQPFNYYARFDPTTTAGQAERAAHLKDYTDFSAAIANGTLPPVAFYKPQGNLNQHPGYTDVMSGDAHIAQVISQLQASPQYRNMAIIVTYDENGGFWDHVAPPRNAQNANDSRWGPGTRMPAIIISPYAKTSYIDSTPYDTTSIIKFITRLFGLDPLPGAVARSVTGDLSNAFDLTKP